jgi:transposase
MLEMPRYASPLECPSETRDELIAISRSRTGEVRMVERARMVLACLEGKEIQQVAQQVGASVPTVSKWRSRFALDGIRGLRDRARSGKPPTYDAAFRDRVFAPTTEQKKREDFRRFLDAVVAELPTDKEIHVIVDNYSTHKRNADWLEKYQGRLQFHFTPTTASWLNQVEIWFGLLTRKALRGASFANKDQLRSAIESFVTNTNRHPSHSTGASEKSREVNSEIPLLTYATKNLGWP